MNGSATPTPTPPPGSGPAGARAAISLVVVNARIPTGRPGRPWADALAVRGDRLAAVGSSAEIRKLAAPGAQVVDARGGLVVPGTGDTAGIPFAVGSPAHFVLLDRDPTGLPATELAEARAVLTVVDGAVVANRGR